MPQAVCNKCNNSTTVEIYGSINVAQNPQLKDKVKDGSLFVWGCPDCGARNLATYETLYHDPDTKLMIWLRPQGSENLGESLDKLTESLSGYTLRMVESAGELIEKVSIFDSGLDDTVIEMCKYVSKLEMAQKMGQQVFDIPFKFHQIEGADNNLIFAYPLNGQMQGICVGFNVYEDCRGILQRNPSVLPNEGFASVNSAWVSGFMR